MTKLINFTIKLLATLICFPILWLHILIVVIMWDEKFLMDDKLFELIWRETDETKER
jgi:hypothetical protein